MTMMQIALGRGGSSAGCLFSSSCAPKVAPLRSCKGAGNDAADRYNSSMTDHSSGACFTFSSRCGRVGHTHKRSPRPPARSLCATARPLLFRKRHIWHDRTTRRLAAFTPATVLLLELYSYAETGERQRVK